MDTPLLRTVETYWGRLGTPRVPASSRSQRTRRQLRPLVVSNLSSISDIKDSKTRRITGTLARRSFSGKQRYTVAGLLPAIMSAPVKADWVKQRTIRCVRSGYSLAVSDSHDEERNRFSS